jgi:ketosteroid isomerase-like protein
MLSRIPFNRASSVRRFCIFASVLALGGCVPKSQFDAAAESAKLLRRDAEWADLASAGKNVDSIVSYWTDDAVIIEPGQPVVEGKAAIRNYVAESFKTPGFKIHWVSEKPTFSPDGKLAYMRGTDEMTVPGPKGAPMTLHLRGYSIWRLEPDGQWRCVVDIANEAPAPAA